MQLNVISGPPSSGKTTRLLSIAQACGQQDKVILAESYTEAGLERKVRRMAESGATAVFIDGCSERTLRLLHLLEQSLPAGLQVHAAT